MMRKNKKSEIYIVIALIMILSRVTVCNKQNHVTSDREIWLADIACFGVDM
jgi:hypothetical protein